jgi:hypothetical protein
MTHATANAPAATPLDELSRGLLAMLHEADPEVERIMAGEAGRKPSQPFGSIVDITAAMRQAPSMKTRSKASMPQWSCSPLSRSS